MGKIHFSRRQATRRSSLLQYTPNPSVSTSADSLVHPLMDDGKHPNLHLLLENRVSRVLFDDSKRAIGVEYEPTKSHQPSISLSKTPTYQVYANKLVVVSAGALGTPSILERSGVGDAKILNKLGINLISDLPDVGEHYQGLPISPIQNSH